MPPIVSPGRYRARKNSLYLPGGPFLPPESILNSHGRLLPRFFSCIDYTTQTGMRFAVLHICADFPAAPCFLYKGNGNNGIPSLQTRPHRSHPKSLFSIPQSPAPGNMVAAAVRPIPGIGTTPHKAHQRKSHINQHSSCLHIPIKKPLLL